MNIIAKLLAMATVANFNEKRMALIGSSNGHLRQRFTLSGLPPKWKGKRMARIMRGGK